MILIPTAGILGAAIGQCMTYLFIFAAVGMMSWRLYPLDVRWLRLGAVGLGSAMAGVMMSIQWHTDPFASLVVKLPVVAIVSSAMAWLIAPDWCKRLMRMVPIPFRAE